MSLTSVDLIVLLILAVQIFTLSFLLSRVWRAQRTQLLIQYPQSQYPNFYVTSQEKEFFRLNVRKWMDNVLMVLGGGLLAVSVYLSLPVSEMTRWLLIFSFIQILPASLSSFWCRANDAAMSTKKPSPIRKISLSARHVTDYVSTQKLGLTLASFIVMFIVGIWALASGKLGDNYVKGLLFLILGGLCVAYLIAKIYHLMYGKKSDHFMKPEDRERSLEKRIPQLCQVLTFYSLTLTAMVCFAVFSLSSAYLFVFTSVVLQIMMFLSLKQPIDMDREVYR